MLAKVRYRQNNVERFFFLFNLMNNMEGWNIKGGVIVFGKMDAVEDGRKRRRNGSIDRQQQREKWGVSSYWGRGGGGGWWETGLHDVCFHGDGCSVSHM